MFLRWRFFFAFPREFLGLSGQAWQAVKYSVRRRGLGCQRIAAGRKVGRMMQSRSPFPPSSFRDAPEGAGPESILTMAVMDSGLAAARRPGMTTEFEAHLRIPAARFRVRVLQELRPQKVEGAGNAGRWPHPQACVLKGVECTQDRQVKPKRSGTPCAMALRLTPRAPRCVGLFSHRRCADCSAQLDPSVEGTGPRGLTVRVPAARLAAPARPSHPAPRFVTTAKRLFGKRGTAIDITFVPIFGK